MRVLPPASNRACGFDLSANCGCVQVLVKTGISVSIISPVMFFVAFMRDVCTVLIIFVQEKKKQAEPHVVMQSFSA